MGTVAGTASHCAYLRFVPDPPPQPGKAPNTPHFPSSLPGELSCNAETPQGRGWLISRRSKQDLPSPAMMSSSICSRAYYPSQLPFATVKQYSVFWAAAAGHSAGQESAELCAPSRSSTTGGSAIAAKRPAGLALVESRSAGRHRQWIAMRWRNRDVWLQKISEQDIPWQRNEPSKPVATPMILDKSSRCGMKMRENRAVPALP